MRILLTKADRFNARQLAEVSSFMQERLYACFGKEFEIAPYSITVGYDELRRAFNRDVLAKIALELELKRQKIVEHKFSFIRQQCQQYLSVALTAALKARTEQEALGALIAQTKQPWHGSRRNAASFYGTSPDIIASLSKNSCQNIMKI